MSDFISAVKKITDSDKRFQIEAYSFVMESLQFYNEKRKSRPGQHITAVELLDGFKEYALNSFGPMTLFTLHSWGIKSTQDVGLIVYNMIEEGMMGKTKEDSLEDFSDVFLFKKAFKEDFFQKIE